MKRLLAFLALLPVLAFAQTQTVNVNPDTHKIVNPILDFSDVSVSGLGGGGGVTWPLVAEEASLMVTLSATGLLQQDQYLGLQTNYAAGYIQANSTPLIDVSGFQTFSAPYWFDSLNNWRLTGDGSGLTFGGNTYDSTAFGSSLDLSGNTTISGGGGSDYAILGQESGTNNALNPYTAGKLTLRWLSGTGLLETAIKLDGFGNLKFNDSFFVFADANGNWSDSNGTASSPDWVLASHADSNGLVVNTSASHADSTGYVYVDNAHADSQGNASGPSSHADSQGSTIGGVSHADSSGVAQGDWSHADSQGTSRLAGSSAGGGNMNYTSFVASPQTVTFTGVPAGGSSIVLLSSACGGYYNLPPNGIYHLDVVVLVRTDYNSFGRWHYALTISTDADGVLTVLATNTIETPVLTNYCYAAVMVFDTATQPGALIIQCDAGEATSVLNAKWSATIRETANYQKP